MGIKTIIAQKRLRKLIRSYEHMPVVPNLDTLKTIGVIWQPSNKEAYLYLKNFFEKRQVIFRGFCVFDDNLNPHPDSNTITKNDLNWLGFPKHELIEEFTNFKFDVLINTSLHQNLILDYLTLLSRSKFKIGSAQNDSNFFDLNINIGEKDDALFLVKQQIFYLAQLNKTAIT